MTGWPLDHIAVACADLVAGEAWLTRLLGAPAGGGGAHPLMGTHNRLWSLGPADYLELIAIDPAAPAPGRTRWFGLDGFAGPPRLAGWVVQAPDRTPAPEGSRWETAARGDLHWRITIAEDGRMPPNGLGPALIDWGAAPHPATRLPDHGLRLTRLALSHPAPFPLPTHDPRITLTRGPAAMTATLSTPTGPVTL